MLSYLKSRNITDLVVCGMMTHMCVNATVRAAKDFGFSITLIADACATRNLEVNGQIVKADYTTYSGLTLESYFREQLKGKQLYSTIGSWWETSKVKNTDQNEIDIKLSY